jgi:outer membrane lipoprotein-sorting protein
MSHLIAQRIGPAVLLVALVATGCGTSSKTNPAAAGSDAAGQGSTPGGTHPGGAASPGTTPGGLPGGFAPSVPGAPAAGAAAILTQMAAAWANCHSLSGHYDFWEKSGTETEIAKVDVWFQKPGRYRLEVSDATDSLKRGSRSVFDTQHRTISSRPGGPLSFVKIDGTLDDARSKSVRGYTLDQTDYASHINAMLAGGAQVHLVQGRGNGPTLELSNPSKFHGIDALRETLDPQKMLPTYFEMTEKGQVVHTRKFTSLNVNPSISSDKFSL